MEDSLTPDATLSMLVGYYEAAEQATVDSRAQAELHRDYRNGDQWTAEEIAALNKRKQPIVTIDRIGPKVDFLLGMEQSRRTDPKAYPRTPDDQEGADAATDGIRYVLDANRWDRVRSACFDCFIVEGSCGADVRADGDKIEVLPIMWDRTFFDPHSRKPDFSDGKYSGQFVWMDVADATAKWPKHADQIEATVSSETSDDTFGDVPRVRWADPKRKRVRIVEIWTRERDGVWFSQFTKSGILSRVESPYRDSEGAPEIGFIFGSCNIDRDGNRFGVVKRWVSLQDEINKRRSKAMHLLSVRQIKSERGAVDDVNRARAELAKPDGWVEFTPGMALEVLPTNDMAAAQFQLLQEAKSEIDAVGVNAALSGTEQRVMSGRALMARSEQGLNELGPVFDGFAQWQLDVYRAIWNRIRQFWTAEKWVRVTDDERNLKFVGLNQPLTLGDQLIEEAKKQGQEMPPEVLEQVRQHPGAQRIVGVRNNVAEMDVDIVLDSVPATASLQIEQFQALAEMAKAGVPIPPEALIEASQLRNKEKILQMMRPQGEGIPPQVRQVLEQAQGEIQRLQGELQAAQSGLKKAEIDAQGKAQTEAIKAQSAAELQASKDAAAYDREELKGMVQMLLQQMQPPVSLATDVAGDMQENGGSAAPVAGVPGVLSPG